MKIYLDHAATTPVDKDVLEAMLPYFSDAFGNPSSVHSFGQEAMKAVNEAREKVAKFLGCQPEEVIFTSGATEADNLAIRGILEGIRNSVKEPVGSNGTFTGQESGIRKDRIHIITTAIEHPAVLEVCKHLEKPRDSSSSPDVHRGTPQNDIACEVTYVKPQSDGVVRVEDIKKEIKENTVLISVMYVNNEIGTIQPIREIGEMIKSHRKHINHTNHRNALTYPLFHTDAVQAVNYCPIDVNKLNVDLVSLSGHKIYGPKGIGVLYLKKSTPLKPIQFGGHHEFGLRPGTLNTPLIIGLGKAIELVSTRDNNKLKNLRDYLWQALQKNISGIKLNGSLRKRIPSNLNVSIRGVEGESLLLGLDLEGIAVSTGSACSSGSLEPSHVLMAIGLSHEQAHGSLRITLGKDNTQEEIDYLVEKLTALVIKLRSMAPQ